MDKKEQFLNIARMVYLYTLKMKEHHLIDEMMIDHNPKMVNANYGRVENDSAYVVEYSRGVPSMIYSGFGAFEIPAAKLCRGHVNDYKAFQRDVDAIFGQLEMQPMIENRMDMIGPRYIVSKMPWLNQVELPLEYKPQSMANDQIGSEQEQAELAMIFDANNQYFRKIGHPEFVHSEPEKAAVVAKPVVKAEPKKRFCIIAGQLKQFLKRPNPDKGL